MSFGGRVARGLLIAAVAAAVGAATLPVLLKQATPTEEAIARVALPPPRPSEGAKPATIATAPLVIPTKIDAASSAPAVPPLVTVEPADVPPVSASVSILADPLAALARVEPPAAAAETPEASPAPATTAPPAASATLEPFPPVQALTIDAAENVPPPAQQATPQLDVPIATASLPLPSAEKPAWRKRVASTRTTRLRYVRRKPFSFRALLAVLHLR